ncbi:MAG: hypothetical protein QG638_2529 [Pseudomonadota bacterium]|nr:hypothetical protein [Pseudomonadota bacterium]
MSGSNNPALSFASALAGYVLRGGFSYPGGHLPPIGHRVSEAFAGVGVAASSDPATDDFIIAHLHNAGIRHVRLDFTYGDDEGPAGRLLEALYAASFKVVLHLIQPFERARRMESVDAREEWQRFVVATLDRHGNRATMVEVGSTVNRRRWAGYSLPGFLSMWEIAWREVRARKLVLAGPSVTDFEPPWSVGLLALLRRQGQLPDVHTDNLFSERCTEPERYDHKIFGHRLAPLARVNLIKKARMLQRIGTDFGTPRLFSPAAFWTLPRIERMLPDSEEKQADYLARYMVLCAASGALEGAWWGPLICHREGLIDDGVPQYPKLERITHYAAVTGALTDFRIRPALHALKAFAELIPGSCYEGRLNASQMLEMHAFRSEGKLVHAIWTINGRAAALIDLYSTEDLQSAEYRSRDGVVLGEMPSLASEAPLYLYWPPGRKVRVKAGASVLKNVAIHRHAADKTHYFFRENGWQGVVLAADAAEASLLLQAIHPERIGAPPAESILRHARNAIWTMADPREEGARLVVKQPVKMHLHKKLLDRFKPSKGLRSWNGTCELLRRGVAAAPPVAWFEKVGSNSNLTQNYYICEYVPVKFTARELVAAFAGGADTFAGIGEEAAYRQLCAYLLTMHGRGILFRDLSGGNILIDKVDEDHLTFSLIDTGRIHVFRGPLSLRQRFADLVRICNKLHGDGRRKFLTIYLLALRKQLRWWHCWPFFIYDAKVTAKRHVGRKAWKRLFSGARK